MSFLGDIGHKIGGVLDNKWTKGALAAGLAATGVGIPLSAAIMAGSGALGGALHEGGGLKDALRGGATGALEGGAAGVAGGALRSGAAKTAGSFLTSHLPGAGAVGGAIKDAAGRVIGGGSGGGMSPLMMALAAAQTANAANLGKKANDFADQGWNLANDDWKSRAGLRTAGIDNLLHPVARDTSALTALRGQNPVARRALPSGPPPMAV